MAVVKNYNTASEITIEDLFNKIDTYLIGDVEAILEREYSAPPPNENPNRIAYPCLITILSGMELLGILISGDVNNGFVHFWNEFAAQIPRYNSNKLRRVFRLAIRNGIAHHYLPKAGLYVHYRNPNNHLRKVHLQGNDGLYISCSALFNDFLTVYEVIKERLLSNPKLAHTKEVYDTIKLGQKIIDEYLSSKSFHGLDDGKILSLGDLSGASGVGSPNGDNFDHRYLSV